MSSKVAPRRSRGRPPLGEDKKCRVCGKPRTRWVKSGGENVPACATCYNRETYEPARRKILPRPKKEYDYSDAAAKRAAEMLRKGAPWSFVCEKIGASKRTITIWMGRLASTESY